MASAGADTNSPSNPQTEQTPGEDAGALIVTQPLLLFFLVSYW